LVNRETILADGQELTVFEPQLTELQLRLLDLLNVPMTSYVPT